METRNNKKRKRINEAKKKKKESVSNTNSSKKKNIESTTKDTFTILMRQGRWRNNKENLIFKMEADALNEEHLKIMDNLLLEQSRQTGDYTPFYLHISSPSFEFTLRITPEYGSFNPSFQTILKWERGCFATLIEKEPWLKIWDESWFYFRYPIPELGINHFFLFSFSNLNCTWSLDTHIQQQQKLFLRPFKDLVKNLIKINQEEILILLRV